MITTIFSKSRPFNYVLILLLLILCFFLVPNEVSKGASSFSVGIKVTCFVLLSGMFFLSNFIAKRNGLTRDSNYPFLFFFLFLLLFPLVFNKINLIVSNLFVLLALRRLISLQSLITPKEKIFDASLLIFVATLFHFWSILFILLVFISIIMHVSRDYRNWVLPYIALFSVAVIFCLTAFIFDKTLINDLIEQINFSFKFDYFTNNYQNIALSIFVALSVLFFFSQMGSMSKRPLVLHASYKKIIFTFVIAVIIFVISDNKSNDILIFTFMPLAIMATSFMEGTQEKWIKETTAILIIITCFILFYLHL